MSNDNLISLGTRSAPVRERYPEFHFEIGYSDEARTKDTITGFLTAMGGIYFIGSGFKPTDTQPSEVDWLWSAPFESVQYVKSLGPSITTTKLDA